MVAVTELLETPQVKEEDWVKYGLEQGISKILPEIKGAPIWAKLVFVVLNKFILRLCSSLNLYLNKSATSFFVSGLCKKLSGPKLYFWDETLNPLSEMYPPLPCIDSGKSLVAYVELLKEQTEFPFFHLQLPISLSPHLTAEFLL